MPAPHWRPSATTGCGPRGLMLARDKALAKQILTYHRIRVPDFVVFPRGAAVRRPRDTWVKMS